MSSERPHHELLGRRPTGTTAHGTTLRPGGTSGDGNERRRRTDDDRPGAGTRARIVSLRAEVELLEAERGRLANRVRELEADVAELEAETAGLERSVANERRRRQRVVDRYEGVIAEKEAANRTLRSDPETAGDAGPTRPLAAVQAAVRAARAGVRRLVPTE